MTEHRTPLNPSQNKFSHTSQYSAAPQTSIKRTSYKNYPSANRPLSRRVEPSPILIQENVSESKKPLYKIASDQNVSHDVLKFSKNFQDIRNPPTNPARTSGNSGSGNEILGHQARESPRRTVRDLTLANLQLEHLPKVDLRTPTVKTDFYRTSTSKDNRYGREVASIAEFKYGLKEGNLQNHVDLNFVSRALRTEGDVVVYKRDVSRGNSSENAMRRNSAVMQVNGKSRWKKDSETLKENQVSDDVQYGAGGVGYSAGGKRREKVQEGEPLMWGNERRGSHAQSSADKKVICVEKETMSKWKHDISEIRRDIEKRKKSYEKVERFITMHAHHKQHDNSGERKGLETLPAFAGYKHHSLVVTTSSQATGPTLATMQTQPAQPGFERIISPSFSSAINFPPVSLPTPLFGPSLNTERRRSSVLLEEDSSRFNEAPLLEQRRNGRDGLKARPIVQVENNDYGFENERERYLCKAACCESNSGCQMF